MPEPRFDTPVTYRADDVGHNAIVRALKKNAAEQAQNSAPGAEPIDPRVYHAGLRFERLEQQRRRARDRARPAGDALDRSQGQLGRDRLEGWSPEFAAAFDKALNRLPGGCAEAVRFTLGHGPGSAMTQAEIAEVWGVSQQAVSKHLAKAFVLLHRDPIVRRLVDR